jgi:DNA invertase Pin-like site-specific DNA recombinase
VKNQTEQNRIIGYARVSDDSQELDLQLVALRAIGAAPVFTDKMSGMRDDRPGLAKAMAEIRAGDTLAVWKLDRLGRSTFDLLKIMRTLREANVAFRSITEAIDTATASGELVYTVLSAVASYERSIMRERIKAGIRAKKNRGEPTGRKPVVVGERLKLAIHLLDVEGHSYRHVAGVLKVGVATVHAAIRRARVEGMALSKKPTRAKPGGRANPPRRSEDERRDDSVLHSVSLHSLKGPPTQEGV